MAKNTTARRDPDIKALATAAAQGKAAQVRSLLQREVSANALDAGRSILSWAMLKGNAEVVRLLLEAGADPNPIQQHPIDPELELRDDLLFEAVKYRRGMEVMSLLVKAGADVNPKMREGSALELACGVQGSDEQVRMLLDAGADVLAPVHRQSLGRAIGAKRASAAKMLIDAGALRRGQDKPTLLAEAAEAGLVAVVKILLDMKVSPDSRSKNLRDNASALMGAAAGGHVEIVKMLLAAGADPGLADDVGHAAVDWVKEFKPRGATQIIELLQSAGGGSGGAESEPQPMDFRKAAKAREFQAAVTALRKKIGKRARALADVKGGVCFKLKPQEASSVVEKRQAELLKRGCLIFACDAGLAVLPTSDDLDAVRAMQTAASSTPVRTVHIIQWIRETRKRYPMLIIFADEDRMTLKFTGRIGDGKDLARRLVQVCPDLEEEGIGPLVGHLKKTNSIGLGWSD